MNHEAYVRAHLRRLGASPSVLDDLTQEVWLVALARSPSFANEAATRAWLSQVCRRVAAGERRTRARSPLLASETPDLPVDAEQMRHIESALDDQQGLAALAGLREEQVDLLSLYGSGELSMREVAEILGAPEATVYSRYRAAISEASSGLRRSERAGRSAVNAPDVPQASSKSVQTLAADQELAADRGELVLYRCDADMVVGRIGNVIVTRWRRGRFERTVDVLGSVMDSAAARMSMPLVLLNDGDADVVHPNAAERKALRNHIRDHSHQASLAVDIFNTPFTRFIAGIINGIMLVTRSSTSFAMVPSPEAARRWVEPRAFSKHGAISWSEVLDAFQVVRAQA